MAEEGFTEEIEALRADLGRLKDDLSEIVKTWEESGKERATAVKSTLEHLLSKLEEELSGAFVSARGTGANSAKAVVRQVEQRPLLSLLAAFGVGLFIGKILDRR